MFRNREIRRFAFGFLALTLLLSGIGFLIHPAAGVMALFCAAAFGSAFFIFNYNRYQYIARLSEQIDLVLHNADRICIEEEQEGELSILRSEISKMTLRIREQNEALKTEKERLARSLADIAHQLRTPLTSANLLLSLLEQENEKKERMALLRETEDLFVRMEWLINALLKLSRLDAGIVSYQKEEITARELIDDALRPLLAAMELHEITLRTEVPADMLLYGDKNWLQEALLNILKNSLQSAGQKGRISIRCQDNPLFGEIAISDSGSGFAKEDLPHLFERFYRGKNADTAGYGIGLSLCKQIVTGQGGTVTAQNAPSGGAVFILRFPKQAVL